MVSLRIRNKNHLKNFLLPIFDKYPMFSNKQYDYLRFKDALLNKHYFPAWLVGFIEAEACFSVYKLKKKDNDYLVASFDIAQKDSDILISAIRVYLSFTTTVYLDQYNCSKLKVTGVRSIENTIKFLQYAPVKLMGNKRLQYLLWIKQLRTIPRYSEKINLPSKY